MCHAKNLWYWPSWTKSHFAVRGQEVDGLGKACFCGDSVCMFYFEYIFMRDIAIEYTALFQDKSNLRYNQW